jgi:hypothetical protein
MLSPARVVKDYPRLASAAVFALAGGLVAYASWLSPTKGPGDIPLLCAGVALAHAVAAAILGRRLIHDSRDIRGACATGATISAAALVAFTPWFAVWVSLDNVNPRGLIDDVLFTLLVGVATFLAGWWAIMLLSAMLGGALYAAASRA